MLHVVIMAGGSGTRFWPASRRLRPKQFLALAGDDALLRITFDRLRSLVPPEQVWVITAAATAGAARDLLPELAPEHVIGEPAGRDTAACVGLAAHLTLAQDPEATCVVLPADHVISDEKAFCAAMASGAAHVEAEGGLLTFGIQPTRPETGYGYLEVGEIHRTVRGHTVHRLARFVEKPDLETAQTYLTGGRHLWNSGMFAWRSEDLLAEIRRQLPMLAEGLDRIAAALGTESYGAVLEEVYPTLHRVSVDFGVMEGATTCWTVPVDFPWSDVGSWPTLGELLPADGSGNATRGRVMCLDARSNVVVGDGPAVAVVGVEGLVVVATPDAVLVVPADEAQRVKDVVNAIDESGWQDLL